MQPTALSLVDWRRRTHEMYANVRHNIDHEAAHERWRAARDEMFLHHDQSPLTGGDAIHDTGVPYWPYDPALRLETRMLPAEDPDPRTVEAGDDGQLEMRLVGRVELPDPVGGSLDVWWLHQYGGGLFIPLRDGTSGDGSYGGGRYLLDTAKGSWLGGEGDTIVLDLNYAYHPSCRYNPRWQCPLAPPGNTITARIEAGEKL